ncbi:MAG: LytTR family transcriptional regulator [Alistipes senegalensis]|nr:LytTR family transcriptional regulator [Bacteroides cellulosilyticus]MCM1352014.1 LytTR family transcriptional regulator [Alistipes senegalensis]
MRYLATIGYWAVAVLLLASVAGGFGYPFDRALFVASAMLPGMFCAKFFLPEAFRATHRRGVAVIAVGLGVVVVEWVAMLLAHRYTQADWWQDEVPFPTLFSNPVFLLLLLAAIVVPETLLARYLDRVLPHTKEIAFVSDRRRVTLGLAQIVYIESNDDEVLLHTLDGASYRTKTRISQWERLLDDRFVRIHRAYIVNSEHVASVGGGQAVVAGRTFDLSRKYREEAMRRMKKRLRGEPTGTDGSTDDSPRQRQTE